LERHVPVAKHGDERAVLQVHHVIQAVGTLSKGFCDWMPGNTSGAPPPAELAREFAPAGEAVLTALEALKHSMLIRTSARFSFSRMLGVLGSNTLEKLPRWIDGLLSQSSTKDEMATFLRVLDQVVFGFKTEIISILDQLLTPLLQRVLAGLSEPTTGTDDAIQLGELKMQYLQFILVILNNDLAPVLVSSANQQTFETILTTLEHFCRDSSDYPTARLSLAVLTKMTQVWGGPDLTIPPPPGAAQVSSPTVPGFDSFIMQRFSPLTWSLVSSPSFQPKDAQARSYLTEAATLQWTILRKTGLAYETHLRETEMRGLGLQDDIIGEYIKNLEIKDKFEFKKFFVQFVQQVRS
jgi:exportin-T